MAVFHHLSAGTLGWVRYRMLLGGLRGRFALLLSRHLLSRAPRQVSPRLCSRVQRTSLERNDRRGYPPGDVLGQLPGMRSRSIFASSAAHSEPSARASDPGVYSPQLPGIGVNAAGDGCESPEPVGGIDSIAFQRMLPHSGWVRTKSSTDLSAFPVVKASAAQRPS